MFILGVACFNQKSNRSGINAVVTILVHEICLHVCIYELNLNESKTAGSLLAIL